MIQLYSKITKLGWLDSLNSAWVFRDVIAEIDKFLQGGLEKCIIGVQLLELLIVEVDKAGYADNARPLTKQRKTASSFRDTTLLERFEFKKILQFWNQYIFSFKKSIQLLRNAIGSLDVSNQNQLKLVTSLLNLAYAALTFDFIGTCQETVEQSLNKFLLFFFARITIIWPLGLVISVLKG